MPLRANVIPQIVVVLLLALLLGPAHRTLAEDSPSEPKQSQDEKVFGLTKVHQFHLRLSAKEYAALEPQGGGFPPGFGGPPGGPGRPGPLRPGAPGEMPAAAGFGLEFPYVHAKLTAGDQEFEDVALRYKGNATYMMASRQAKRPLKIDFDRFDESANLHGVKKLNLHSGFFDSTKTKDSLAYAVFRAAGVPAPRTALAEVRLTVPGRFDAECLGLYSVVEQVDKAFLKSHFKSAKGLLLKPEGMRGIKYLGDNLEPYEEAYGGKTEGNEEQWQRLIAFARLVDKGSDEEFQNKIGEFLDVEGFLRSMRCS